MHIAILTFDGFNELDSLIAYGMLSRISLLGDKQWRVSIASPSARVTSMNGLTLDAHIGLQEASSADAILIGSGMRTREVANDASILSQIKLNPSKQLIAAQCSGTFLLVKLGLLGQVPACTDTTSKPAQGNIATAGGCLSAQYITAWMIARLKNRHCAREVLHYFAPVNEKDEHVTRAMAHVDAHMQA
jgi:putative intracellular protease/amidase